MENQQALVQQQFALRASTFDRSAHWITDPSLARAHVTAAGKPGRGIALCCGTGAMDRKLAGAGWDLVGVDLSAEMLAEASRFFPTVQANVEDLPFAAGSFDLAIMRQAYFFLNGPRTLAEVKRVLKPGGRFVLSQTVPFSQDDTPWLRKIHETKQAQMVRFLTEQDLAAELLNHGFEIVDKTSLVIRESVTLWMANAPEMEAERREKVLDLVLNAPESYDRHHRVSSSGGEITEDWNWVVFTARAGAI